MLSHFVWIAGLLAGIVFAAGVLRALAAAVFSGKAHNRARFWSAQAISFGALVGAVVGVVAMAASWGVDRPQLTAVGGWLAAGLTIALQRVITAFAGYVVILRSRLFTIGDRITIDGVRGDVVALGFMQTTVMEMGQTPKEQADAPSMWVNGRQYTGRLVRITNDKIFDAPVYNYTRDFPFLWSEITIPVRYQDDYHAVERILLTAAAKHTQAVMDDARPSLRDMGERYFLVDAPVIDPRVYMRLTDNWIELALRFLARDRGVRDLHDAMTRDILADMQRAGIGVASGTYAIVELPPVRVTDARSA